MTHAQKMTTGEFLAWESRQELRHEFDGVRVIQRDGVTAGHAVIQRNLIGLLYGALRGGPAAAFGGLLQVRLWNSIRYPDACVVLTRSAPGRFATCGPPSRTTPRAADGVPGTNPRNSFLGHLPVCSKSYGEGEQAGNIGHFGRSNAHEPDLEQRFRWLQSSDFTGIS